MPMNYQLHTLTSLKVLQTSFTDKELKPIKDEIIEIQADFEKAEPFNDRLAGHIKKEYGLPKSKDYLELLVKPILTEYIQNFFIYEHAHVTHKIDDLSMGTPWVNFQKKYEFNPFHHHSGVISFVLWITIPYLHEHESNMYPNVNEINKTGLFEFQYLNYLGQIQYKTIPADKKYENTIILFPAGLKHCVYPFYTSDDYRISVSGNFNLNYTKGDRFNLEYR
jgi:hypothetical protein